MTKWVLSFLLLAAPLYAQAHADVVGSVKNDLQRSGADLAGPCGALTITKAVALALVSEGAGLLDKPAGNNCNGFAVDIIAYADGRAFDILTDSGGANGPAWQPIAPIDPSRYRAVSLPPSNPIPSPAPTPVPAPAPGVDGGAITESLKLLAQKVDALQTSQDTTLQKLDDLAARIDNPGWLRKVLGNKYVQLAEVAVVTWYTQHMVTK